MRLARPVPARGDGGRLALASTAAVAVTLCVTVGRAPGAGAASIAAPALTCSPATAGPPQSPPITVPRPSGPSPSSQAPSNTLSPCVGDAGAASPSVPNPVAGIVGGAVDSVTGLGADAVLHAMTKWVADGTASLLVSVGGFVDGVTAPDVGAGWFEAHYRVMSAIGVLFVLPLLFGTAISSIIRQDGASLVRAVALHLPAAVIGTAIAVKLVQLALGVTDELCALVLSGSKDDPTPFLSALGTNLQRGASQSGGAAFALVIVAVVLALGAFAVATELVVRSAAVYVALLFLPLALAGLVWPVTLRWARRLVELLAVLILSKFVVVAVLSLASSALQGSLGGGGLPALIGGASLLVLAAFAPYALIRLVPVVEGGAVAHLEGVGQRARSAGGPVDHGRYLHELIRDRGTGDAEGLDGGRPSARPGARPDAGAAVKLATASGARRRVGSWSEFGSASGAGGTPAGIDPLGAAAARAGPGAASTARSHQGEAGGTDG